MPKKLYLVGIFAFVLSAGYASGLQCYQCSNVEVNSQSSVGNIPLEGQTDPTCGKYPTPSNTVTCGFNEVCGSSNGRVFAYGLIEANVQLRGCVPRSLASDGCTTLENSGEMSSMLGRIAQIPGIKFSGQVCACSFDYCVLCDGGVMIGDTCVKFWILAVITLGALAALVGFICCCCCCGCCGCCCSCCACCRKDSPGVVHSPPYHTLTVIQTPPTQPLSVQSGDILHQPANHMGAVGGAYLSGSLGLVEDKERAGYNQKGDNFGASLA